MTKKYVCCICGKEFEGYGNNPWPIEQDILKEDRCCDKCNLDYVIPARIALLANKKK